MKKALIVLLVLFAVIAMSSITLLADDAAPGSAADNACNVGGSLEGKCDWPTEAERVWAWTCGWYIARAERAVIGDSDVPAWCFYRVVPTKTPLPPV